MTAQLLEDRDRCRLQLPVDVAAPGPTLRQVRNSLAIGMKKEEIGRTAPRDGTQGAVRTAAN
ncbi:MAG: hypothetical protein JNL18_05380 [Planctomycetaceae bacterium]|uniref:Uncharacterized protein n=1 Tax=Lacipirellula limnantheis TaxID=2528024 RepID=A0A517U4F6_9BACT|nr:hypothetical protein [Lacipirellula limnantheis]MBL9162160.1 hypothetical protein [Planctomycetaceae bacterium]QDT75521.1 hypothetical protein I41_47320 [Lacipirellula limnantheis]